MGKLTAYERGSIFIETQNSLLQPSRYNIVFFQTESYYFETVKVGNSNIRN
jgi:hypothetical protein